MAALVGDLMHVEEGLSVPVDSLAKACIFILKLS